MSGLRRHTGPDRKFDHSRGHLHAEGRSGFPIRHHRRVNRVIRQIALFRDSARRGFTHHVTVRPSPFTCLNPYPGFRKELSPSDSPRRSWTWCLTRITPFPDAFPPLPNRTPIIQPDPPEMSSPTHQWMTGNPADAHRCAVANMVLHGNREGTFTSPYLDCRLATPPADLQLVGAARFELTTPCTQNRCATRLRHAPTRSS